MPSKHLRDPDSESEASIPTPESKPVISSPEKKAKTTSRAGSVKKTWSATEEAEFLAAIDSIARKHLWNEVKGEALASRGANGIRSHWDALYKKLQK